MNPLINMVYASFSFAITYLSAYLPTYNLMRCYGSFESDYNSPHCLGTSCLQASHGFNQLQQKGGSLFLP